MTRTDSTLAQVLVPIVDVKETNHVSKLVAHTIMSYYLEFSSLHDQALFFTDRIIVYSVISSRCSKCSKASASSKRTITKCT
jgi:hypothetical protein